MIQLNIVKYIFLSTNSERNRFLGTNIIILNKEVLRFIIGMENS